MSAARPHFSAVVPQFGIRDLVHTAEYYRDFLGFEIASYWDGEVVTPEPRNTPQFAIVRRDQVQVFFNRAEESNFRTGRTEGGYDAYFHVTGIEALADELRSHGADIVDGPDERVYGQRELVVRDCNGLLLCFAEAVTESER